MFSERLNIPTNDQKEHIVHRYERTFSSGVTRMEQFHLPAMAIGVIGTPTILYLRDYDPDQEWLPFMNGTIMVVPPPKREIDYEIDPETGMMIEVFLPTYSSSNGYYHRPRYRHRHWQQEGYEGSSLDENEREMLRRRVEARLEPNREYKQMYYRDEGSCSEQKVLQFAEFREIENEYEYKFYRDSWDHAGAIVYDKKNHRRVDERVFCVLNIEHLNLAELRAWLNEHTRGLYWLNDKSSREYPERCIVMEYYTEWMHAKLRFDGATE
ncbi:MAG: hypothetical protein EOP83_05390 [Verrucomicrobiaceae bacterium]|nr:MAG: hypothetical protein EOP83_05390 [Verrucomicrobiaceae bacterium]